MPTFKQFKLPDVGRGADRGARSSSGTSSPVTRHGQPDHRRDRDGEGGGRAAQPVRGDGHRAAGDRGLDGGRRDADHHGGRRPGWGARGAGDGAGAAGRRGAGDRGGAPGRPGAGDPAAGRGRAGRARADRRSGARRAHVGAGRVRAALGGGEAAATQGLRRWSGRRRRPGARLRPARSRRAGRPAGERLGAGEAAGTQARQGSRRRPGRSDRGRARRGDHPRGRGAAARSAAAVARRPSAPAPAGRARAAVWDASREQRIPIKGVRKHTAAAMVASAFTAPHVTEFVTVDVTPTMELRRRVAALPEFAEHQGEPAAVRGPGAAARGPAPPDDQLLLGRGGPGDRGQGVRQPGDRRGHPARADRPQHQGRRAALACASSRSRWAS